MEEVEDVYDIGVPEIRHFSLSNGAIVHNCDAMRYLSVSLSKTAPDVTAEDLEKSYKRSLGHEIDPFYGFK